MIAQVGGMPGNNNDEIIEKNPDIIFKYKLGEGERPDSDYVETIQKIVDNLRNIGGGETFKVELISDLLPLHDRGEWLLDLSVNNKGVIGLRDANIAAYKMQIPISHVREIVISKAK